MGREDTELKRLSSLKNGADSPVDKANSWT